MRGVSGQTGLYSRLTGYPELTQCGAWRKPGQPDYSKPPSMGLLYQIQDLTLEQTKVAKHLPTKGPHTTVLIPGASVSSSIKWE